MLEKGMVLRCKTTTKDDVFGTVLWEVIETGLQAPEVGRQDQMDGVKVISLGGSGPSASAGRTLLDSEAHIMRDIANGVTIIVPADKKASMILQLTKQNVSDVSASGARHMGTGVIEM